MKKLAVFASGNGSNFQAIFDSIKLGETDAEISLVVSDKPQAGVIERAKSVNVPAYCFIPKEYEAKADYEHAILSVLENNKIDFVILAGYMRLIGDTLLNAYENRIVNIHPSLLPAFPGKDAVGQAFQAGVKVTGVTVHFVDAGMDTGPIIAQKAIEIEAEDTIEAIAKKIHKVEHMLYPKVIKELVSK
ncbi:phosphoribosylglycinamide formyltransferase [Metabacillus litoralis]|uniref:Phosphoribosylglycinamide formyltransferase n=1 Tax=Metabacillus litoralis TaxID=152268 RepID=A0A5C6VLR1_9BACI|nr:phosphoribosylglycinamide formyltransferase [Metabacillus litoralis]TXC85724.1 phosphoribosylglycinamide formyltransferase [Metabacillus litoralis]